DRPAGRGKKLMPSPVKAEAIEKNIPVFQPLTLKDEDAQAELIALKPDLMIVAAYGLILPKAVLDIPAFGCVNIHASLLPRWRGAAPIQRAIQEGDTETGITIMQMDVGLDTGDMLLKASCPITETTNGGELHDQLADLGAQCILEYLKKRDSIESKSQDDTLATYAHKLTKSEAHVDWQSDAATIARSVRAFNPWPVSYAEIGKERVRILDANAVSSSFEAAPGTVLEKSKDGIVVQCATGALNIVRLQLAGSKAVSVSDFVNGGKTLLDPGTVLN
ncbi:methionyl-tRNA formyltransferase, partial [Oleiphilus sp. HI0118]